MRRIAMRQLLSWRRSFVSPLTNVLSPFAATFGVVTCSVGLLLSAPLAHAQGMPPTNLQSPGKAVAPPPAKPAPAQPAQPSGSAANIVDTLLARMTLEEKLGQLAQWSGGTTPTGPKAATGSEADIRAGHVGSF